MRYDKIIIGAGLYGLYAALYSGKKGQRVLVIEREVEPFLRATYINQARVHMGYHYPRSIYTAMKSAHYFNRFNQDFGFCVNSEFDQIYATSSDFSWTAANEFKLFCRNVGIPCEELSVGRYFNDNVCDGAFLTKEYTYDAAILRDFFMEELKKYDNVKLNFSEHIDKIECDGDVYIIGTDKGEYCSRYIFNATYASVNQIHALAGFDGFNIKYELCEIILCKPSQKLKGVGFTVMDGPFFSIMPFGKTGLHSLTTVTRTPHDTCYEKLPVFSCQSGAVCSSRELDNCDICPNRPETSWKYMQSMARKYLRAEYAFDYHSSRFSMKPILKTSEVDDSRPTLIKVLSKKPYFVSVLSGKINTVYDIDDYLDME